VSHPGAPSACCAAIYAHPAVRWLLGGDLHPGGEATTRRSLELIGAGSGCRLLDVASGTGASALLAAREFGCIATGVEYTESAVEAATKAAESEGLGRVVSFRRGDAQALPFAVGVFDAVLCECSLSTFADKPRAVAAIRRVLTSRGRFALSDVVVDRSRLPAELDGPLAEIACIGGALSRDGYEHLLCDAGLRPFATESRSADAGALADRVRDRLRGARILGLDRIDGAPLTTREAIGVVEVARAAIVEGALGYAIIAATA
jgi:arsenite methyltransferase